MTLLRSEIKNYNFKDEILYLINKIILNSDEKNFVFLSNRFIQKENINFFISENINTVNAQFSDRFTIYNLFCHNNLDTNLKNFYIADFNNLEMPIFNTHEIQNRHVHFKKGGEVNLDFVTKKLSEFNYEASSSLFKPYQFVLKGERLDIMIDEQNTLKIYSEYDVIESIKLQKFDSKIQTTELSEFRIYDSKLAIEQSESTLFNVLSKDAIIFYENADSIEIERLTRNKECNQKFICLKKSLSIN
jgi:transcription-repair coupling factor (superfamily II helicase)